MDSGLRCNAGGDAQAEMKPRCCFGEEPVDVDDSMSCRYLREVGWMEWFNIL